MQISLFNRMKDNFILNRIEVKANILTCSFSFVISMQLNLTTVIIMRLTDLQFKLRVVQ